MKKIKFLVIAFQLACLVYGQSGSKTQVSSTETEIQKILKDRVDLISPGGKDMGIIAGVIGPDGKHIISYGNSGKKGLPLDGSTVFEIASITKVFTAMLLSRMVLSGEVSLNDPVSKLLPPGTKIPERNGHLITLADLATHTSGLPFTPELKKPETSTGIFNFIANYKLQSDPGTTWDYSNLGYWLMGQALASRKGMSYEKALYKDVLQPMKLVSTTFQVSASMQSKLAAGHDASLQIAPVFTSIPDYVQGGFYSTLNLYSTVNDLLSVLSTAMKYTNMDYSVVIDNCLKTMRPTQQVNNIQGELQALGWNIITDHGDTLIYRDGGSFGFASAMVYDPKARVGVVVLSNQVFSVGDIARHILRPDYPLEHPTVTQHNEIMLSPTVLVKYTGQFENNEEGIFKITLVNEHLLFEAPGEWGLPALSIFPEDDSSFFAKELPFRVHFERNEKQLITGILIYPPRGQKSIPAKKK